MLASLPCLTSRHTHLYPDRRSTRLQYDFNAGCKPVVLAERGGVRKPQSFQWRLSMKQICQSFPSLRRLLQDQGLGDCVGVLCVFLRGVVKGVNEWGWSWRLERERA